MMKLGRLTLFFLIATIIVLAKPSTGKGLGKLGSGLGVNCPSKVITTPVGGIPSSFDARATWSNCISPIRDQGDCGSCWAFASTQVLTDRICIASNNTIKRLLAPQDLVDCSQNCQKPVLEINCNEGCNGGFLDTPWTYFQQEGTIGDSCVNYQATELTCSSTCTGPSSSSMRYYSGSCYKLSTVADMQAELVNNGPIMSGYTVYEDFDSYTSGVYIYDGTSAEVGGHAIRILGWGTEDNVDYWLVANSWSADWGEEGYFKIRRGTDECGIESNALAGLADLTGLSGYENYPPPAGLSSSSILVPPFVMLLLFVFSLNRFLL